MTAVKKGTAVKSAVSEVADEEDTKVTFEYDDVEYTVDKERLSTDLDLFEAMENGKMVTPVRMLLGERQYATFRSGGKRGLQEINDLGTLMFEALGVVPGE